MPATLSRRVLKGLLEQCGIEAYISGFYLQGGIGEIPVSGTASVWVSDEKTGEAREIIRRYDQPGR